MNLGSLCRAAAVVILLSASQAGFAQFRMYEKSPVGIGLAIVRPAGSQLRNIKGTWMGPVVSLHLKYDSFGRPIAMASIAWFGGSSESSQAGMAPLKLTYLKRFGSDPTSGWYVGGGVGAYFISFTDVQYDPFLRDNTLVHQTGTPLGVNLLGGVEFGGGAWYFEAGYDMIQGLPLTTGSSVSFNAMSFVLGSRMAF